MELMALLSRRGKGKSTVLFAKFKKTLLQVCRLHPCASWWWAGSLSAGRRDTAYWWMTHSFTLSPTRVGEPHATWPAYSNKQITARVSVLSMTSTWMGSVQPALLLLTFQRLCLSAQSWKPTLCDVIRGRGDTYPLSVRFTLGLCSMRGGRKCYFFSFGYFFFLMYQIYFLTLSPISFKLSFNKN